MKLAAINVHPLKSAAVRPLQQSTVGTAGLRSDREWMVVDPDGGLVSARELPKLFSVLADTPATDPEVRNALRLRAEGHPDLLLDEPSGARVPVLVHHTPVEAVPLGDEANRWLRAVVGRDDVRIVWCDDPTRRSLNPAWARPQDHTAFADSSPVTLVSSRSVDQLNEWATAGALERGEPAPKPLHATRFRPNLVINDAPEPFAEDTWESVRIGDVPFRVVARVDRCVITTIDPVTQEKGKDPIRTLAGHRRWDGKTWFAVKLVPDGEGPLRLGDPVSVIRTRR